MFTRCSEAVCANIVQVFGIRFASGWLEAAAPLALADLQAATEVVDAGVRVDVVVDGVGVALAVPLGGGGGGGGGLDGGHRLPHSHVCPISKGLDGVTYGDGDGGGEMGGRRNTRSETWM